MKQGDVIDTYRHGWTRTKFDGTVFDDAEIRERYYHAPNARMKLKEGDLIKFVPEISSKMFTSPIINHHRVDGCLVRVLYRYYTINLAWTNFGMAIEIFDDPKGRHARGKVLRMPLVSARDYTRVSYGQDQEES